MNTIGLKIKQLRKKNGYTQEELAQKLRGDYNTKTDRAMISKWETGYQTPEMYTVACLSKLFGVSIDSINGDDSFDIFSFSGITPMPKMKKVPRLGKIACGEPIMTDENYDGLDNVPENIQCDFSLKCDGDSMINARINDGDIVYIRQQSTVENGEIAAVMVNNETTLKRVYIYTDKVVLQAENPKYEPWVYVKEELDNIRILGKAVGFTSIIK